MSLKQETSAVIPFLKWAGGKRWLVKKYADRFELNFDRYVEPFVGSGAVFFHLAPHRGVIADMNARLVETYCSIRDEWQLVWEELQHHQVAHSKEHYYNVRQSEFENRYQRAAKFIYLNRTCFNGIYRVNLRGEFNVPIGTKTNVVLSSDNFEQVAMRLQQVEIKCADFADILKKCGEGDFVFVDPPYTVQHNYNGFIKYNEKIFSWADQIRLRDTIFDAANRGAKILMSNADHESIRTLYKGMGDVEQVNRSSIIAASAGKRGQTTEILCRIG